MLIVAKIKHRRDFVMNLLEKISTFGLPLPNNREHSAIFLKAERSFGCKIAKAAQRDHALTLLFHFSTWAPSVSTFNLKRCVPFPSTEGSSKSYRFFCGLMSHFRIVSKYLLTMSSKQIWNIQVIKSFCSSCISNFVNLDKSPPKWCLRKPVAAMHLFLSETKIAPTGILRSYKSSSEPQCLETLPSKDIEASVNRTFSTPSSPLSGKYSVGRTL